MASEGKWHVEKALVLATALKLVEKGLVLGKAGNVSQRLSGPGGNDLLVITPTSRYYDSLMEDDMPVVDLGGRVVEGSLAPSSELKLHVAVYRARRDVGAVVHTHSVHASALAIAGVGIPAVLEEEVSMLGGEIRVAKYGVAGSAELAHNAVRALGDRNAVILANHGVVGTGRTLREALHSCELVEKAAHAYLLSMAAGRARPLPAEAVLSARKTYRRSRRADQS